MIDKNQYLQLIVHARCPIGEIESSTLKAFKIDDDDGIAKALGFHPGMINKVDYFVTNDTAVKLIELSDLKECMKSCDAYIDTELRRLQTDTGRAITQREEREVIKAAWKDIKVEFCKKWSGSIAVIERLYRKTNELGDADPSYKLLIVCKDHTDTRMLDTLKDQLSRQLSGMMGHVVVCTTKTLSSALVRSDL